MQKTKKQLLGLAGLAAVGIMTAVACAMPSPDAAAISGDITHGYECDDSVPGNECAKGNDGTQVQVVVSEGNPTVNTASPQDGSTLVDPMVKVSTNYSEVTQIDYYMNFKNDAGVIRRIDLASFTPTETSGVHTFNVDISSYGYGEYTLYSTAHGYNGATREDAVTFNYRAASVSVNPETGSNGDPSIDVAVDEDVDKVLIQIYDKNGNPIFVDKDGNETPIEVDRKDIDPETGKINVSLPFEEYGVDAGDYTVVIVAKDDDGNVISMVTTEVSYKPIVPEVPNTSAGLLAGLNITCVDYLLTGLIAFALVAGFAMYLVCRKNRR